MTARTKDTRSISPKAKYARIEAAYLSLGGVFGKVLPTYLFGRSRLPAPRAAENRHAADQKHRVSGGRKRPPSRPLRLPQRHHAAPVGLLQSGDAGYMEIDANGNRKMIGN